MVKFNKMIEQALEYEEYSLLTDAEIGDTLVYYWESIEKTINDMVFDSEFDLLDRVYYQYDREFSNREIEIIQEYFIDNAADLLAINYGMWVTPGYFSLISPQEIEIDLQEMHLTEYRKEVINYNTDLYIPDSINCGYITTDMHLDILIDIDAIDNALLENLEEVVFNNNLEYK